MASPEQLGISSTLVALGEEPTLAPSAGGADPLARTEVATDPHAKTEAVVRSDPRAPTKAATDTESTRSAPSGSEPLSGDAAPLSAISAGHACERYTTVKRLGEGGMGVVEQVWDSDLMRMLAVKRLQPNLRTNKKLLRQFLWEARIGAHLDHPNIVPVHDLGLSHEGELFFTMKHVRGRALDEVLEALRQGDPETLESYPMPRRLRVFLKLCEAMEFAHSRGVVHRDLKPANVMLGEHGEVFVMDWGIAVPAPDGSPEMLHRAAPADVHRGVSGTPGYMSPEQANGQPVDARSDVYTLGAILYELVSLARPIEGDTLSELLERAKRAEHRPLKEVLREASSSLEAVVERALMREASARYASAAELAHDVEVVMDGRTPTAESVSMPRRLARYWVSVDRARLRPMDLDFLILGGGLGGCAAGIWLSPWLGGYSWAFLIAGLVVGVPPLLQWFRGTSSGRPG